MKTSKRYYWGKRRMKNERERKIERKKCRPTQMWREIPILIVVESALFLFFHSSLFHFHSLVLFYLVNSIVLTWFFFSYNFVFYFILFVCVSFYFHHFFIFFFRFNSFRFRFRTFHHINDCIYLICSWFRLFSKKKQIISKD